MVETFLNDPLVAPLYGLLVLGVISMLLGGYRALQQPGDGFNGTAFDFKKLPGILDTTVLRKVLPLFALGVATVLTAGTAKVGLQVAYTTLAVAAYSAELQGLIDKVTGAFVPTTKAEDEGVSTLGARHRALLDR